MKKASPILAFTLLCTPLLASTIPFTNATQCTCIIDTPHDNFMTCSNQGDSTSVYVGKIINSAFSPTHQVVPGQTSTAPITLNNGSQVIAWAINAKGAPATQMNLSLFNNPKGLTLVAMFDPSWRLDMPVESRCLNIPSCTYNKSDPTCSHNSIVAAVQKRD
jgi:hypothetical protein